MLNRLYVQKTLLVLTLVLSCPFGSRLSAEDANKVGIVSHVKVLSDKVEDVSSPEAWKRSYITPGMSDQEKVLAIWRTVVKYRHQIDPPNEYLQDDVHDIFKTIHVYGYGQCCCASSHVETLARYLGMEARGWAINLHSVPEVQYDNSWHTVDGSLMNYFLNADGRIASVADIKKAVLEWHSQHPGYRGNDGKLREFAASGGWKKGPALLASTGERFWDANGINMAGWHGWPSTMQEYDCKEFVFDYGGSMGYELNVQLRVGERLTRNWFNRGMHVNQLEGAGDHPLAKDVSAAGDVPQVRRRGPRADRQRHAGVRCPAGQRRVSPRRADGREPRHPRGRRFVPGGRPRERPGQARRAGPRHALQLRLLERPSETASRGWPGRIDRGRLQRQPRPGLERDRPHRRLGPRQLDLKKQCYRRYDYRLKIPIAGQGHGAERPGRSATTSSTRRPPCRPCCRARTRSVSRPGRTKGPLRWKARRPSTSATRKGTSSTRRSIRS